MKKIMKNVFFLFTYQTNRNKSYPEKSANTFVI